MAASTATKQKDSLLIAAHSQRERNRSCDEQRTAGMRPQADAQALCLALHKEKRGADAHQHAAKEAALPAQRARVTEQALRA